MQRSSNSSHVFKHCVAHLEGIGMHLPIIPHLGIYYFIHHLQMCISIGYALPMFNTHIIVDDFECMWNYGYNCGLLENLTSCLGVYTLQ
jgi:hypothetical protein